MAGRSRKRGGGIGISEAAKSLQFSGSSRVKIKEDVNRTLFNPYTLFTFWHHYQNPIVILLHYLINIAGQFF